jgi:uncharacterized RDD family membrane protein YckC
MASSLSADAVTHFEDTAGIITGEAVALDLRPTSFVMRAAGAAIDFVLYVGIFIGAFVLLFTFANELNLDTAAAAALQLSLSVICLVVVPITVEIVSRGRSLGRLAIGSRIVRDDGGAIGFRHAFIRGLTGFLEIFATLGGLAAIVGLLNSRAKRLGDLLAGTYSQNERVARVVTPILGVPSELVEWSRTADVAPLPDPLARRVSTFLDHAEALTGPTRLRHAHELAHEVSVFVSPVPAVNAEVFLAAVAAVRRDRERAALESEKATLARLHIALSGLPRQFPDRG